MKKKIISLILTGVMALSLALSSCQSSPAKSVVNASFNEKGELILTYSDDTTQNMGVIKEEDGSSIPCEHQFSDWETQLEATCTSIGYDTRTCFTCNFIDYQFHSATEHDYTDAVEIPNLPCQQRLVQKSCSTCGETKIEEAYVNHLYDENGVCSECGDETGFIESEEYIEETTHDGHEALLWWNKDRTYGLVFARPIGMWGYWYEYYFLCEYVGNPVHMTIPSSLNGYPISAIGVDTFIGTQFPIESETLESITIPESITSIQSSFNCPNLKTIVIENKDIKISKKIFQNTMFWNTYKGDVVYLNDMCLGVKNEEATSVRIKEGITHIASEAFTACPSLTEVTLPSSLTSWDMALDNITSIKKVILKEGLTTIASQAFYRCTSLTEVVIPESVTSIKGGAFYGCTSLTKFIIPENVTSIGGSAFYECTSLTEVLIPEGVTDIGNFAFYGCTNLTTITLPDTVTTLGKSAFYGCSNLANIELSDTITEIQEGTFTQCTSLKKIELPKNLKVIGKSAFYYCLQLEEVIYPTGLTDVKSTAFAYCVSLKDRTLPESVVNAGEEIFQGCDEIVHLQAEEEVVLWSEDNSYALVLKLDPLKIFYSVERYQGTPVNVVIPEQYNGVPIRSIATSAFARCLTLETLEIPGCVKTIGSFTFKGCKNLKNLIIHEGMESLYQSAFEGCSSLVEVNLPNSITYFHSWVFEDCVSLKKINIPTGLTNWGFGDFRDCTSLTEITIPENIKEIPTLTFENCTSLKKVYIKRECVVDAEAFKNCHPDLEFIYY